MSNMVSLAPILPGHEDDIRRRIAALGGGGASPFQEVPGTHFAPRRARSAHRRVSHIRPAVSLKTSWLLLAVDFDGDFALEPFNARRMEVGEIRRYLRAVDDVPDLRTVWQDCYGFRPDVPLEDLLEPTVVERFVLFRNHGDNTLRQILPTLAWKRAFVRALAAGRLRTAAQIADFLGQLRQAPADQAMATR